jgi:carbon monoxide dehydrogenase subunit G
LGPVTAAVAAENVSVEAQGRGTVIWVDASARIRAPQSLIWDTLTDYERLSDFIPGMQVSRLITRRGTSAIVAQKGKAGIFLFNYPIDVVVESVELPPGVIEIHVVRGNVKHLDGRYLIEQDPSDRERHVLRWQGAIEPVLALPAMITAPLLRSNIRDQFLGMVSEIERRNARRISAVGQ